MSRLKIKDVSIPCMLNTEIGAVLAVLRRWPIAPSPDPTLGPQPPDLDTYYYQDIPAIQQSLRSLRSIIFNPNQHDWRRVDPSIYLSPFLDVILSDEVPAIATMVSLSAILNIIKMEIFNEKTPGAKDAMNAVVVAITGCRLEKSSSMVEEAILMIILQIMTAAMNTPASILLSDDAVCTIVNTCFNVLRQSTNRGDLLKRTANYTMHEIIRNVYSRLSEIEPTPRRGGGGGDDVDYEDDYDEDDYDVATDESGFGVRCAVDIFHFLCSLLNAMETHMEPDGIVTQRTDEEVQLFALVLMNTALEMSGDVIGKHQRFLRMVQDDLIHHLIHYGTRSSSLVFSMICSTIFNIYNFLRKYTRLQLEAFFIFVLQRVATSSTASIQHVEVALEGVINFCRNPTFLVETYVNYDCAFMCTNLFEEIGKLLSKQAFPMGGGPLTNLQIQAFEGLLLIIHAIADNADKEGSNLSELSSPSLVRTCTTTPFWEEMMGLTTTYRDEPGGARWIRALRTKKSQKRQLLIAGNHFNQDDKKGIEYLKIASLVPRDSQNATALAYFFRYTPKLDKTKIGEYLGDPDEFHLLVLKEFTHTFDFYGMILDSALRSYLETFRLPGESQKIQRILESFSERFYDHQAANVFESKDAVFVLCYSVIMLNTDQHNPQVKKKMTEEEFIRNNRAINGGKDLPRQYLSELFQSIANKAISLAGQTGPYEMTPSRWIELINRSRVVRPFCICKFNRPLGVDMFTTIAGPSVATLCAIFEFTDDEDILSESIEALLSVARIAQYGLEDVMDELVASLCKFTTLLNPYASPEETLYIFANEQKPRMATLAMFTIINNFGESIRGSWRSIVDCLIKLKRLKLLPQSVVDQPDVDPAAAAGPASSSDQQPGHSHSRSGSGNIVISGIKSKAPKRRHSSSMTGRLSHALASEGVEDSLVLGGSEFEQNLEAIKQCNVGKIFNESSNLPEQSLHNIGRSLIFAASGKGQKFSTTVEEEETVGFCWDLILAIGLANVHRIPVFWPTYLDYIITVCQFPFFSGALFAEKGFLTSLKIYLRFVSSYNYQEVSENNNNYTYMVAEDLIFKTINLMWKLGKDILDNCYDVIMEYVARVINDYPQNIQTPLGWKSLLQLLSVTGRHPEAYDVGVETFINLLSNDTRVSKINYVACIDCAFGFVALKNSPVDKNLKILDLMANSVYLLIRWYKSSFSDPGGSTSSASMSSSTTTTTESENSSTSFRSSNNPKLFEELCKALKRTSLARREEIRNEAVFALRKCYMLAEQLDFTPDQWTELLSVAANMVDDLHEKMIEYSKRPNAEREMRSIEMTLRNAMELLVDVFSMYVKAIEHGKDFRTIWMTLLRKMDHYMKTDLGEHDSSGMQELVPRLLKKLIADMKEKDILVPKEDDDLWETTYIQIQWIAPSLKGELFPDIDM